MISNITHPISSSFSLSSDHNHQWYLSLPCQRSHFLTHVKAVCVTIQWQAAPPFAAGIKKWWVSAVRCACWVFDVYCVDFQHGRWLHDVARKTELAFCRMWQKMSIDYVNKIGQKVMGQASKLIGILTVESPEDINFRGSFLVFQQKLQKQPAGRWLRVVACSLLIIISFNFFGHLHLWDYTPQTTSLCHLCLGGMISRPSVSMYAHISGQFMI